MGKAYDGKKRWNETILATTARASAAGGRQTATKKRLSGTAMLYFLSLRRSKAPSKPASRRVHLKFVIKHDNCMGLQAERTNERGNEGVDDDTRNEVRNARLDALEADNFGEDADDGDGAQDGDEAYVDEEEGGPGSCQKKRRTVVPGKKKWKVKSLAQLVFEELGNGENAEGPNYLTAGGGSSYASSTEILLRVWILRKL
ncbi:hypothetical protein PInf_025618 [Phytophthora infestans]|nr:hypothetical protein PInf_025618 [Phytophthora infestans]